MSIARDDSLHSFPDRAIRRSLEYPDHLRVVVQFRGAGGPPACAGGPPAPRKQANCTTIHLRSFLRQAIPQITDRLVCEQAKRLDREFPTDDWRRRESDLLFEIPFRADDGLRLTLVCVLIEHQSEPDPLMPLRTLLYALFFWERQWKEWEQAK